MLQIEFFCWGFEKLLEFLVSYQTFLAIAPVIVSVSLVKKPWISS